MRLCHAAVLCGIAFFVGRQSSNLAPTECSPPRPGARRLLAFFNGRAGKAKGRGMGRRRGKGLGKRRGRVVLPALPGDADHRRQERIALQSSVPGRCVTAQQAADFFQSHKRSFLNCGGDERRVIAALALLSPGADKVNLLPTSPRGHPRTLRGNPGAHVCNAQYAHAGDR